MKFPAPKLGFLRGLLALSVSFAVAGSSQAFAFALLAGSNTAQTSQSENGDSLIFASAAITETGVRIEWASKPNTDNLGFNVYRLRDGVRTRLNREVIPGSVFAAGGHISAPAIALRSHSHGWFDAGGTAESIYYIESVSLSRASRFHEPVAPVFQKDVPGRKVGPRNQAEAEANSEDNGYREVGYPAASFTSNAQYISASTLEDQWAVAAQTGVKIGIKKQGWYRVTQPQMAAVGFNPTVDIRNLQLFADGLEVAINTSQSGGLFGPSDYIEFFGSGIDVLTSDTRTYYLIAGASPGKRVRSELQIDSTPTPTATPAASPAATPITNPAGVLPKNPWSVWPGNTVVFSTGHPVGLPIIPLIIFQPRRSEPSALPDRSRREEKPLVDRAPQLALNPGLLARGSEALSVPAAPAKRPAQLSSAPASVGVPEIVASPIPSSTGITDSRAAVKSALKQKRKRNRKRVRRKPVQPKREYSHTVATATAGLTNFQYTVERKDRSVYFSSLLNGDEENWFGQVIATNPASQTINTPNPDLSAAGPARLEVRLQGVSQNSHQVSVKFNETLVGNINFFGVGSPVLSFNVPVALLQNGANTLKFTPAAGGDVTIVNYARITYPHLFRADSDTLKFSLLGTQTIQIDGFSSSNVQVIDYTDPFNARVSKAEPAPNGGGSGSTVVIPPSNPKSKTPRLLYATAAAPEQPAALSLNQPSTLNLNTNTADFVIITTNALKSALQPLVAAREAQGMNVDVVDVDDVYDEFGYGLHGPQAIKDFLARANAQWTIKPKYVIFAGDASNDPRNYTGAGNLDFVPTKLVDATYNETSSDDWLADFNDNGIADIPIGRLPVGTVADTNLVISKIVGFAPVTPESAMLVADDPTGYYFNFEQANDQVEAQLPPSMNVQRVNVRLDGPNPAKANIIAGFNAGRALVNYTGHGNVDVWSGASIFKSADATALTNGNKLSFVIVMDCLNGYYHQPGLLSLSEAFLQAPAGGAVAAFASSGLTLPDGQHAMSTQLYSLLYGSQPIALGDAIKIAKGATTDIDVRRTWIFFGDPSMRIR